jgi:hypothetical protein
MYRSKTKYPKVTQAPSDGFEFLAPKMLIQSFPRFQLETPLFPLIGPALPAPVPPSRGGPFLRLIVVFTPSFSFFFFLPLFSSLPLLIISLLSSSPLTHSVFNYKYTHTHTHTHTHDSVSVSVSVLQGTASLAT